MTPLKQQAIETALLGNFEKAIALNEEILKENPNDIETLNRLAFAYIALHRAKHAKETYQRVLQLDSQNPIALKNLKRLSNMDKKGDGNIHATMLNFSQIGNMFIEESGKTKIIDLINVAPPQILSALIIGEQLSLRIKRLKVFVLNGKNQYIGMLPDDIGKRLIKFLNGGNTYEAYIKSVNKHIVNVFIREIKRSSRFKGQPSFLSTEKQKPLKETKSKQIETSDDEEEE